MVDSDRTIWTIGHSTRSLDEFLTLLTAHEIRLLVDVRRFPVSRRHPQFQANALAASLSTAGLRYHHLPELGGRRTSSPNSPNVGWRNAGFRGYADYMQTAAFAQGLETLLALVQTAPTALMCAEAVPWRCHRSLIADALVARGDAVRHILAPDHAELHQLTAFAVVRDDQVWYPSPPAVPTGRQGTDTPPRLF